MNFDKNDLIHSNSNDEHLFALCNLCFWSATVFFKLGKGDDSRIPYTCPLCFNSNISLIPLSKETPPMKYQTVAKMV